MENKDYKNEEPSNLDVVTFVENYLGVKLYSYQKIMLRALIKKNDIIDGCKHWLYKGFRG